MAQEIYQADDIMKERKRTYEQSNVPVQYDHGQLFGMVKRNSDVLNEQAAKVARLNELDNVHANIVQLVNSNKTICASFTALQESVAQNNSTLTSQVANISTTIKSFTEHEKTRSDVITTIETKLNAQTEDLVGKTQALESVESKVTANHESVAATIATLEAKIATLEGEVEAQKHRGWLSSFRRLFTWRKNAPVVAETTTEEVVPDEEGNDNQAETNDVEAGDVIEGGEATDVTQETTSDDVDQ